MSADTDSEMRQLNTRIPTVLDEEIDNTWQVRGFASKSEFVRHALRAAVGPVELSEETRAILKETEGELERGETIAHGDLKRELDLE
jgi:Arc/MetJ-type ribon-helix-helix transcriptional regulator